MNWIKENKFLSGLIALVIIGGGAFGYLLFAAMGKYDEASTNFESQAGELHRLQGLAIYPSAENVQKLKQQREDYRKKIDDLSKTLRGMELPIEPMSPEKFQDTLKKTVTDFAEKANAVHMRVTEKFLGFDKYQSVPPRSEDAAAKLGRQLKAIVWVLDRIAEAGAVELAVVKPSELPEERGEKEEKADSRRNSPPGATPGGKRGEKAANLPRKDIFTVAFVADEGAFRKVVDDISSSKSPFYIIRTLETKSTAEKPPMRELPGATDVAPPAPAPDPNAPAPAPSATPVAPSPDNQVTKFVVGEEKIQITLLIEVVSFPQPAEEKKNGKVQSKPAPAQ